MNISCVYHFLLTPISSYEPHKIGEYSGEDNYFGILIIFLTSSTNNTGHILFILI